MKLRPFILIPAVSGSLLLGALSPAAAQPSTGGPQPGGAGPIATPLDGGASLLLASGIGLGLRQLRQRRRARNSS